MLRLVFSLLLLLHGVIHFIGFANEWKLAAGQFAGKTLYPLSSDAAKVIGLFWLLAGLLFVLAAGLFFGKKDMWWMFAAVALVLSQLLIVLYWPEAKFGTIANVIILLVTLPAFGAWRFEQKCQGEIPTFLAKAVPENSTLTANQITTLPPIVQRWLHRSIIIGQPMVQTVQLHQTGEMRTKPDGSWMPFQAQQFFTINPPGFYWKVSVDGGPIMQMTGRDQYLDGRGQMFIQWQSLFPVANTSGPETDQGSLLRYLAELVWFPMAATQSYIHWQQLDSLHAQATMTWGGVTASGTYEFDADGDMLAFEADRYMSGANGSSTLERWQIKTTAFCEFHGVRIPCAGEVTWKLKTGNFNWFKYRIADIDYDSLAQ